MANLVTTTVIPEYDYSCNLNDFFKSRKRFIEIYDGEPHQDHEIGSVEVVRREKDALRLRLDMVLTLDEIARCFGDIPHHVNLHPDFDIRQFETPEGIVAQPDKEIYMVSVHSDDLTALVRRAIHFGLFASAKVVLV